MAEVKILCPICHKPNTRTSENFRTARFCQHCGSDVVLNNLPGSNGPRYYITRVIKQGGQGAVYEAIDDTQRIYAVKEMLDRFTDPKERDEAVERFEEEAAMLVRLSHPRIPRVYASFEDEKRHYLAMDFVRGEDLEDVIRRDGSISEARTLEWAAQIFDVIEYLHRQTPPIIFRDMKPSNIMIEQSGGVKIIDFGIAKMLQGTQRGTQIGTPGYAPPEQYQGLATIASDIYSLGATLHHMLTGRDPRDEPPFSFPPVYGLKPTVSRRTSDAIQKALQMKPEDRWRSVAEFRAALLPAPQPAQVRVAPAARPAAAAQVNRTPAQAAASTPRAPAPQPAPRPAQPAPVQAARPAAQPARAQATPAAQTTPAPAAKPSPQPVGIGGGIRRFFTRLLVTLVVLALVAATLVLAFPNVVGQYVPIELPSLPIQNPVATPSPQVFIQRSYEVELEVVVPAGQDVRAAFEAAYLARAQAEFGPTTRINSNVGLQYVGGAPETINEDAAGATYRATMSGFVLVPQG
jgi:eukaryotic-like serine/threonine-protein kinase